MYTVVVRNTEYSVRQLRELGLKGENLSKTDLLSVQLNTNCFTSVLYISNSAPIIPVELIASLLLIQDTETRICLVEAEGHISPAHANPLIRNIVGN